MPPIEETRKGATCFEKKGNNNLKEQTGIFAKRLLGLTFSDLFST